VTVHTAWAAWRAAGLATDLRAGVAKAATAIDSGAAARAMEDYISMSRGFGS
jgi:anthranilate phosphoribosyltransferase